MRIQAIRASETLYKAGDRSFAADYSALTKDPSVDVVIQAMLTMNRWKVPDAAATIKATMESNQARGVQVVATTMLNPPAGRGGGGGRGGPLDRRAAGAPRSRRDDLQRAVLRLPWAGRLRHAETGARHDDGAAAGGIAARQRTPRLHRQGRSCTA